MKQLEYTSKNLYGWFKPEEVCFVVAKVIYLLMTFLIIMKLKKMVNGNHLEY